MSKNCEGCAHFCARKPQRTAQERWEADTRPERPKGFIGALRWFYDPQKWRAPAPDDWEQAMDAVIREDNAAMGVCRRFPRAVSVHRRYYCSEFRAAEGGEA